MSGKKKEKNLLTGLEAIVGKVEDAHKDFLEKASDEVLDDYQANLVAPAINEFYTTLVAEIDKRFEDGSKHISKKDEKKLKEAAVAALKAFFKKALPSTLEALADVKDVDEQYKLLSREYNAHMGLPARTQAGIMSGIDDILSAYVGNKLKSVNALKLELYGLGPQHAQLARRHREQTVYAHTLGQHQNLSVAQYLRKQAEKKGYEVDDHAKFLGQTHEHFPSLLRALHTGNFGDAGHEAYHLKKKEAGGHVYRMADHRRQRREAA